MNKKLLVILAVVVLGFTACSKSDDKTDEATTNTTQAAKSSTDETTDETTDDTEEEDETDSTEGLKPKINLGGLSSGTDSPFSASETECMEESIGDDPAFADIASYEDIISQQDREAFWSYVLECTGPEPLVALFMEGFADGAGGDVTDTQLSCVEDLVNSLSAEEGVLLLAGDPTVTAELTTAVTTDCLS